MPFIPPHQISDAKSKKILDKILKLLYNNLIMKNKKQNIVAKYARKFVKAVTMRDRTKYSKKVKHKGEEKCNY